MNIRAATSLCVLSAVLGLAAIAVGVIPFAIGLHEVTITGVQLGPDAVAMLKDQPGGQTLINCAEASMALANKGAEAYNSLARVSRSQSLFLMVGGIVVAVSNLLLLYWLRRAGRR